MHHKSAAVPLNNSHALRYASDRYQTFPPQSRHGTTHTGTGQFILSPNQQDLNGSDENDSLDMNDYVVEHPYFNPARLRRILAYDGDDLVRAGSHNDEIWGGRGNDILAGGGGDDMLYGQDGDDRLFGGTGNDQLRGGSGNDILLGDQGHDQLWGGSGNDELQGNQGDDHLHGESGNDRLYGDDGNDRLYGGSGDDLLIGGAGDDYLDGGRGADIMRGGQGNDTYVVDQYKDEIIEQPCEGYDTVISSISYLLDANVEALILQEGRRINGHGNSLDNRLVGNSRHNILDGGTGADTMIGGAGNDTYYVDDINDKVIERDGEGRDTVKARVSYILPANLENLNLQDFSKGQRGMTVDANIRVYGYPTACELDYEQGNAVAGYKGTCALTAIANLSTQAGRPLSEEQVVQRAVAYQWALSDPGLDDQRRGSSNYQGQQALLKSFGIRNGIVRGYSEQKLTRLIKDGHGVLLSVNAGKLWNNPEYLADGGINHVVTLTGIACDARSGVVEGFYIADSGRGKVSDMMRYVPTTELRRCADVAGGYAIYSTEPVKLWNENINATGNAMNNTLIGNRGNNVLTGGKGNDKLIGGVGNDTYVFSRGDGCDTIIDHDATRGNMDVLKLVDLKQKNLWFGRVGNDLKIRVKASQDQILVKNWYVPGRSGMDNQIEQIQTADGLTLYNRDVDQLVQAMAAFSPPAAGQAQWSPENNSNAQILLGGSVSERVHDLTA
jgi:Ca2+-binding RTX toxin-like protein